MYSGFTERNPIVESRLGNTLNMIPFYFFVFMNTLWVNFKSVVQSL
jgi:hypothetical protein